MHGTPNAEEAEEKCYSKASLGCVASRAWRSTPVIPALRRLRQEDGHKREASLSYGARSRLNTRTKRKETKGSSNRLGGGWKRMNTEPGRELESGARITGDLRCLSGLGTMLDTGADREHPPQALSLSTRSSVAGPALRSCGNFSR